MDVLIQYLIVLENVGYTEAIVCFIFLPEIRLKKHDVMMVMQNV